LLVEPCSFEPSFTSTPGVGGRGNISHVEPILLCGRLRPRSESNPTRRDCRLGTRQVATSAGFGVSGVGASGVGRVGREVSECRGVACRSIRAPEQRVAPCGAACATSAGAYHAKWRTTRFREADVPLWRALLLKAMGGLAIRGRNPYAYSSVVMASQGVAAPSFSGLGRRPFTAVARVRIPLGLRTTKLNSNSEAL
jgi:hypothetical protein